MIRAIVVFTLLLSSVNARSYILYFKYDALVNFNEDLVNIPEYIRQHSIKKVRIFLDEKGDKKDKNHLDFKFNRKGWLISWTDVYDPNLRYVNVYYSGFFPQIKKVVTNNEELNYGDSPGYLGPGEYPKFYKKTKVFRNKFGRIDSVSFKELDKDVYRDRKFLYTYNSDGLLVQYSVVHLSEKGKRFSSNYMYSYNELGLLKQYTEPVSGSFEAFYKFTWDEDKKLEQVIAQSAWSNIPDTLKIDYRSDTIIMKSFPGEAKKFDKDITYVVDKNGLIMAQFFEGSRFYFDYDFY